MNSSLPVAAITVKIHITVKASQSSIFITDTAPWKFVRVKVIRGRFL